MWARDRQIVLIGGLDSWTGRVFLLTVTAPGSDRLPWACTIDHRHSGELGCRVEKDAADRWNATAARRWGRLWQEVRNRVRFDGPVILAKAWEPQKRGVSHLHAIVPIEHKAAVIREVEDLAADFGFGYVDRKPRLRSGATGRAAAAYLASYLGDRGKVAGIIEATRDGVIPSRAFYVATVCTRASGLTMRFLRLRRRAWAVLEHGAEVPKWAPAIEWDRAMDDARGRLESRGPPKAVAA